MIRQARLSDRRRSWESTGATLKTLLCLQLQSVQRNASDMYAIEVEMERTPKKNGESVFIVSLTWW